MYFRYDNEEGYRAIIPVDEVIRPTYTEIGVRKQQQQQHALDRLENSPNGLVYTENY